MTRALILAAMLLLATPRSEPNGSLVATGQLTPDKLPSPVHSARTSAPLSVPSGAHRGTWAFAAPSHGSAYLATPERVGTRVRVCGPLGCRTLITNDVGPVLSLRRAGRIGDLSAVTFGAICGDLSRGLCAGSYVVLAPLPPLPPTDEEAKL